MFIHSAAVLSMELTLPKLTKIPYLPDPKKPFALWVWCDSPPHGLASAINKLMRTLRCTENITASLSLERLIC